MKFLVLIMVGMMLVGCGKEADGDTGVVKPNPSATDDPEPVTEVEFEKTKVKAEAGDAEGQFNLGVIYAYDSGRGGDFKEAAKWWRKAAEQGQLRGQLYLGSMYAEGKGVEQDFKEALKWYRKAAEQGDAGGAPILPQRASRITRRITLPQFNKSTGISVCLIVGITQRASVKTGTQLGQDNHKQT